MKRMMMVAAMATMLGCTAGFRIDHAAAGTGLDASVQGPGETIVLKDKTGQSLAGASITINPLAILQNLIELGTTALRGTGALQPASTTLLTAPPANSGS